MIGIWGQAHFVSERKKYSFVSEKNQKKTTSLIKSRERKHTPGPLPGSSSSKAQGKGQGEDKASKGRQGSRKGGKSFDALIGYDGDG